MAISDLMILVGDNNNVQAPSGFKRMDQDLNQGAGGKFIYLAYKDTTSGPFIVDITFVVGDRSSVATPAGVMPTRNSWVLISFGTPIRMWRALSSRRRGRVNGAAGRRATIARAAMRQYQPRIPSR